MDTARLWGLKPQRNRDGIRVIVSQTESAYAHVPANKQFGNTEDFASSP